MEGFEVFGSAGRGLKGEEKGTAFSYSIRSVVVAMALTAAVAMLVHMAVTVTAAAMAAAGVAFSVAVMVAAHGRVIGKLACQEIMHGCISFALYAAVKGDASAGQSILGTGADAAANQGVDVFLLQEGGQSAVACAIAVKHMGLFDGSVLDGIDFELAGVAEVLENLSVVIGDCEFHETASFLYC